MKRIVALALIAVGAILLYFGFQSSQGLDDQVSEALTGNFTDETIYYFIGAGVALVTGLAMLRRR